MPLKMFSLMYVRHGVGGRGAAPPPTSGGAGGSKNRKGARAGTRTKRWEGAETDSRVEQRDGRCRVEQRDGRCRDRQTNRETERL